ncbi:MAG TPA: hypothetical protein VHE60_17730 [Pyrinomonadaceae bacterium]|nr:hypothetical protein [Pyrinomonadaceae bacterium]
MKDDPLENFREQCERNLRRSVAERMRYGFNYVYKPVLDDARWRSFDSMEEYRQWCRENLPKYLGYGQSDELPQDALDDQTALIARREMDQRK